MFNALKKHWPEGLLRLAHTALGLEQDVRAEAVCVETFVQLSNFLHAAAQ